MNSLFAATIQLQLDENNGKISKQYIDDLAKDAECLYLHPTPRTRICILTLDTGHEVIGYSRVLDPKNDVEEIGNQIAFENARDELWSLCGSIALAL